MDSKQHGLMLFVYTSSLMFILRFFAGPIVERTSPLGLLFASGILGATGLTLLGNATTVAFCVLAATVYACGKTFLWPTMLAVASEQFPRGGAITIGAIGGVGMLSAGLLGGPGIGFEQDYYASEILKDKNPAVFERYKAPTENEFLVFQTVGLDGAKVGVLEDNGKEADPRPRGPQGRPEGEARGDREPAEARRLVGGGQGARPPSRQEARHRREPLRRPDGPEAHRRSCPPTMALIYLGMILYFKTKGRLSRRRS